MDNVLVQTCWFASRGQKGVFQCIEVYQLHLLCLVLLDMNLMRYQGVSHALLGAWFDLEQIFKGHIATILVPPKQKKKSKASNFIKSLLNTYLNMSEIWNMQGGPWFHKSGICMYSLDFWEHYHQNFIRQNANSIFGSITAILLHLHPQFLTICKYTLQNNEISHFQSIISLFLWIYLQLELFSSGLRVESCKGCLWLTLNNPCVFIFWIKSLIP